MTKLLLVDGSSYLYRAFHALPDLRSKNDLPTGAIYGVVSMLKRLVREVQSDYSVCVFDAKGKTFRDAWYPAYKANRPAMPEELAAQIAPLFDIIRALGWPLLQEPGVEADDVIGTLARRAAAEGIEVVISTGDKDMAQLVDQYVGLYDTMKNERLNSDGVIQKYGVPPNRIIDYLTLIGDTVDNVPGVPKVGPKTAVKWLNEFGDLDTIIARAGEIGGVVGQNLRDTLAWLPEGRRLITIRCDVPLPYSWDALRMQPANNESLLTYYQTCDFNTWRRELEGTAAPTNAPQAGFAFEAAPPVPDAPRPEHDYQTILTEAQLDAWIAQLQAAEMVSFDTETTGLDPMMARLVGMSFAITPHCAAYLPLTHQYPDVPLQLDFAHTLAKLKPWLESDTHKKVGQNLKYDRHILANHGVAFAGIADDTLLMSYVLNSHLRHNMDAQAARLLGITTITFEDIAGKGAKQLTFDQIAIDRATEYAAEDADITLQLAHAQWPKLAESTALNFVYREIELPAQNVLYKMERTGVLLDTQRLREQSHTLGKRLLEIEQAAYTLAGQPFNLNSPKQVGDILFNKLQIPTKDVRKTATGGFSTDEDVLSKLAADYPLPKLLLEHRSLAKLKSTYTDKLPLMVNPNTGRVHTNYAQTTAVTGRLSSNDPNLQNIPVRSSEGRRIREAFIAPAGSWIVSADYSQIELRIMAHLSGDTGLLSAFAAGEDIHRATASEVFGVPLAEVTSEQRRYAKTINFGLIYGMSAFGLAQQLEIDRQMAAHFIERYFARYPGVARYMETTRQQAKTQGYVETVFGRRLCLPDIQSSNVGRRQGAERAAINAPMQGTAADLIKLAMIAVDQWLSDHQLETRQLMQVHDELVLEVPEAELDHVKTMLPQLMANVAQLTVPLLAEVGVGLNWEAAH